MSTSSSNSNGGESGRKRASKPKVKTGCNNCKIRRVKCDETRPQCIKCLRAGRHCDGYPPPKRTSGDAAIRLLPRPANIAADEQTNGAPIVPHPSSKHLHLSSVFFSPGDYSFDVKEGQYFQVFRMRTASELSGFFNSDFWTRSVLQESHSEASIRHAVVALGALYKTLEAASESPPGSPQEHYDTETAPDHYCFALAQYGKALKRLRDSLEKNEANARRTVLISIVLFTCFQSFTGDHKAAIGQVQHGLRLLEELGPETRAPRGGSGAVVEDELVQMFTRLAIQAKSYDMAFHFPAPYVIQLSPKNNPTSPQSPSLQSDVASTTSLDSQMPDQFTTSQEARSSLDSLTERILRFNEALSAFYAGPNNILPSSIKSHGIGYGAQLHQWGVAFERLLQKRRDPSISHTERAGIDVLKMIHIMTSVLFRMNFSTAETDFDNFFSQFRQIVDLAKEVVVDEELTIAETRCGDPRNCRHRQAPNGHYMQLPGISTLGYRPDGTYSHIKASFALDLGIVPPLFVVATKCRDRTLRREAIALLMSSPRREGMWDSILCGKVGEWIMEVEEEGMRDYEIFNPISTSERVVEDKRVMVKEILFDLQYRTATLRCGTRGAMEGDRDVRARETQISW
ncbi:hypothetical protein OIDMADRAFT_39518 [Oidiodendron maius Zn]|uniref:Zn(2)-C6 fungal-type domain-containing protein n=1 Tax=Oidiodendron maius (strain Zn) TaxID=913774 RepID=A0A0C3D1M7_OIDMZ|nr:hypothetical protein OIDMADRAFT_39518 [Oidiodendron maius Zn]